MYVFIDESGDPGFKMAKGSSPIFVTTMVIFDHAEAAGEAQQMVEALRRDLSIRPEWKFNKCSEDYRDRFFDRLSAATFRTRSIVVQKELIYSEALRAVKESFYKFFIRQMIEHDGGALVNADVVIDGSGDRTFKKQFSSYLRRNLRDGCMKELRLRDSKKDPLLQLADMCAGAVARSYRTERKNADRWRTMLQRADQLDNVWEFK